MWFTCVSFFILIGASFGADPVVKTFLGDIKGYYKKSNGGRTYSAFEGIPFAKPPIGKLRFEEPVAAEPWLEPLDASKTYTCIQINGHIVGDEDCLYLNVYVPKDTPTSKDNLDVIVFIHGGAFSTGSAAHGGPKYFMDRNVVFVSINYRLSVFGFISTQDEVVPGNNGLKDQRLALEWVQKHIKQFGGNPKSVTLIGVSAGAVSVHLHYFSKNSIGLFHRGISNSGTALMPYAQQQGAWERAKELSFFLDCDNPSSRVLIDCLKGKSANVIMGQVPRLESRAKHFPVVLFGPIVEPKSENAFLEDYPFNLLEKNLFYDVPWMNSIVGAEGILGLALIKDDFDGADKLWDERAEYYLNYEYTACKKDKKFIANRVRERYFGTKNISYDTAQEIIDVFGDRYFVHSFEAASRKQTAKARSSVYTYIYNYEISFAPALHKLMLNFSEVLGVGHGEDALLMYTHPDFETKISLTKEDETVQKYLLDIVTSFARNEQIWVKGVHFAPLLESKDFSYLYIESPDKVEWTTEKEIYPTDFWNFLPLMENENLDSTCDSCTPSVTKLLLTIMLFVVLKINIL